MGLSSKFIINKNIGLEVYFKSDVKFVTLKIKDIE